MTRTTQEEGLLNSPDTENRREKEANRYSQIGPTSSRLSKEQQFVVPSVATTWKKKPDLVFISHGRITAVTYVQ